MTSGLPDIREPEISARSAGQARGPKCCKMEKKISQSEEPKVNVADWGGWRDSGWGSFFGSG